MSSALNATDLRSGATPERNVATVKLPRSWRYRWPLPARYALALLLVGLAWLMTFLLWSIDAVSFQTPFFICAIVVSAWGGGFGPGIVATGCSLLMIDFTFTVPYYSFGFAWVDMPKFSVILVTGGCVSWLARQQRRDEEALLVEREGLERKVESRTLDLQEANRLLTAEVAERTRAEKELTEEVSERSRTEKELQRLNRAWRVRTIFNRYATRSGNEADLLRKVCGTMVEVGGYCITWAGYAHAGGVSPAANASETDMGNIETAWAPDSCGYRLAELAIRTTRPIPCNRQNSAAMPGLIDDWARAHGIKAALALPLVADGGVVGALITYSKDGEAFDDKETELFQQAANDLAQGITVLRTREARAKTEAALKKAESDLARVARVTTMGELTASIAHEVNQPLASLVTNANASLRWLAAEPPNYEQARITMQRIVRDGKRAAEVISRIRSMLSKGQDDRQRVSLNDLIQETIPMVQAELERRHAILETAFTDGLPEVEVDKVQIQQVVMNLMVNALDAMKDVIDRPHVLKVRTATNGNTEVVVAVQDCGIGIDEEQAERLFTAFYSTKAEGMGMGLSISRSIMEAHGGRLWAETNDGPGATFTLALPIGNAGQS